MQGGTSINSIVKLNKNSNSTQPYLHDGAMAGFKQAVIIISDGDKYEETIKAIPLEMPPQSSTNENNVAAPSYYVRQDVDLVKSYFKRDINKEIAFCLHDEPGSQRPRNFHLECLEVLFKECTTTGSTYIL